MAELTSGEREERRISKARVAYGACAVGVGVAAAVWGQPLVHQNEKAADLIVTVFSILAGFMVAIFTILGDPGLLLPGSWRLASAQRREIRRRLSRQQMLFYVYMLSLLLIFVSFVSKDHPAQPWFERLYIGLAAAGFVWSLALPTTLMQIHSERVEIVIAQRKGNEPPEGT